MQFLRFTTSFMILFLGLALVAGCGGGSNEEVTVPTEFTKGPPLGEEPGFGTASMGGEGSGDMKLETPNRGKK